MSHILWVLGLSVALLIATEFFFPVDEANKTAKNQKHFWSIMLFIISAVLGFSIDAAFAAQEQIRAVGSVFQDLTTKEAQQQFQTMFVEYHKYFDHASPVLKGWAKESLGSLNNDMANGYIPLPREVAAREIAKVYSSADHHIIAANVGGTAFYFNNPTYSKLNRDTTERGVAVIRFYLFSSSQRLQLRDSKEVKTYTIQEFCKEVQELNEKLGTVFSAVVDVDNADIAKPRDMLIVDNKFVAETEISLTDWQPERALATEYEPRLVEARNYFLDLENSADSICVARMSDEDIRKRFHAYEDVKLAKGKYLADKMFKDVMRDVVGR